MASHGWFGHADMVPGLPLRVALVQEPLHHTLLHGEDRTMAHWLPVALPEAPPVQFSDTFASGTQLSSSLVRLFLE